MKKTIAAAVMSAFLLCGCDTGGIAVTAGTDKAETSQEQITSVQTTQASYEQSAQTLTEDPLSSDTDVPAAPVTASVTATVTAEELVNVEMLDTDFGTIYYPVFSSEKLDADDAKAANALFACIKDYLLADAEELKELYTVLSPEELAEFEAPVSQVHVSLYNGVLSVLMTYDYTFGFLGTYCKSVNFDVSTGKAIDCGEVARAASLTVEDIKNSILWYTKVYTLNKRDTNYIAECVYEEKLPEFVSHNGLSDDEKILCEIALSNYDNGIEYSETENEGKLWEKLPVEHTAFIDDNGQLYVFGTVAPGGQISGKLVAVAHGDDETAEVNLRNRFGAMQRKNYIMPEDIPQLLSEIADPNNDIKASYDTEGIISISDKDRDFNAYSVNVFSNSGFAPALVAKYAVDVYNEYIWEMGDHGQWVMLGQ